MDPDISVNEKDILESIIEIGWYFEMDKKLKVELPSEWTIKFTTESAVQFSVDKYITNTGQSVNVDNQIFAPWQLIIERWAYLKSIPETDKDNIFSNPCINQTMKDLIKTGFTERNFLFPADY